MAQPRLRLGLTRQALGVAAATAPAVAYVHGLYIPEWYAIRRAAQDDELAATELDEMLTALRAAYVPAAGLALGVGVASALLARSWLPLTVSLVTSLGLIGLHETAAPPAQRLDPARALGAGVAALVADVRRHERVQVIAEPTEGTPPPAGTQPPYGL